jgi:hypothetical protein
MYVTINYNMYTICIRNMARSKSITLLCTHVGSYKFRKVHPPSTREELISKINPKVIMEIYSSKKEGRKPYAYNEIDIRQIYTIPQRHCNNKTCVKDMKNHSHHNLLTTKSLKHACGKMVRLWSIIYALFMIRILHYSGNLTLKWKTSLHSSIRKITIQSKTTQTTVNSKGIVITLNLQIHQITVIAKIQDYIL